MLPQYLENQEGWKWPNYCCLSHSDPGKATCSQTILLITGTGLSSCLSLRSRLQLPASPWNYSNQPIPSSCGNQTVPHPLDPTKPAPQPLLFSVPEERLQVFLTGTWRSPPLRSECMWLLNCHQSRLSSVRCHVFGHPHNPSTGLAPSQWIGDKQNIHFYLMHTWCLKKEKQTIILQQSNKTSKLIKIEN